MKDSDLLRFAADLGEVMLASGAETYRVEDTLERILSVGAERKPETFVTTTGIFMSINNYQDDPFTVIKRIKKRGTNLEKLIAANALSRDFTSGKIDLKAAMMRLEEVKNTKSFSMPLVVLGDGIVSGGFALMLGSCLMDGFLALIIGAILGVFICIYEKYRSEPLFSAFIGGAIISALAVVTVKAGVGTDLSGIIVGTAMPLVPGVAITTAIRDIMEGDYVSGVSRMMEAVLCAIAIASGVAVALKVMGGVAL